VGWKGRFGFEENNEWGGKAGKDLKRIMSGVERHVWIEENNEWDGRQVWFEKENEWDGMAVLDLKILLSGVEWQV
jgi:hypothetical protein